MLKKYKNLWISLGLLFAIALVLLLGYAGFIAGPFRAYEKEDRLYLSAYAEQYDVKKVELLNRFTYDKVYYIVLENDQDIVVFDQSFKTVKRFPYEPLDKVKSIAQDLSFKTDEISYGYYHEDLVFVLKNKASEIFITVDDLKLVYHLGSEF